MLQRNVGIIQKQNRKEFRKNGEIRKNKVAKAVGNNGKRIAENIGNHTRWDVVSKIVGSKKYEENQKGGQRIADNTIEKKPEKREENTENFV